MKKKLTKELIDFLSKFNNPLGDLLSDILASGDFPFGNEEKMWAYLKHLYNNERNLRGPIRDLYRICIILNEDGKIGSFPIAETNRLRGYNEEESDFLSPDDFDKNGFVSASTLLANFDDLEVYDRPHIIDPIFKWCYGWPGCPKGYEQYNEDWQLSKEGDMEFHNGRYYIEKERLGDDDWISHLMEKAWFDANTFIPAYFEACRRAGIEYVTIKIYK